MGDEVDASSRADISELASHREIHEDDIKGSENNGNAAAVNTLNTSNNGKMFNLYCFVG